MKANRGDTVLKASIAVLLVVLGVVIVRSMHQPFIDVGDQAPAFHIVTESGKTITPKDFGGRLLVLNFWASWCQPCVAEAPSLNEMQKQLASKGVVVVGVSVDRNEKLYRQFLNRLRPAFQVVRDPDANISYSFGTVQYPETYVIDRSGKVVQKYIGDRNWMEPVLLHAIQAD